MSFLKGYLHMKVSDNIQNKYSKLLEEGGLFFYGPTKGSFILPPRGYSLWTNIKSVLDEKFAKRGVQNVFLPTLIPSELLEKEKNHFTGFNPECFYVERIGEKKLSSSLILRPTSEVLFYNWYRQILKSYHQLPFLYNQWNQVFRAEKNISPFFRNTEFLWQEGHTVHSNEQEAREMVLNILNDYHDYAKNTLRLGVIVGQKSQGEKFAGALESYTIECLLPDGQCLQLATSHYFGDEFCRLMGVKFQDKDNKNKFAFSTSWGTSTRAIGTIAKTHADNWGLILPFELAPVQIAFILIEEKKELIDYYQKISSLVSDAYHCQLYNKNHQVNLNILQADKEGCPFKIILGKEELAQESITLIRRDDIEKRLSIILKDDEEKEQKHLALEKNYLNYLNSLSEVGLEVNEKEKIIEKIIDSFRRGFKQGKIFQVISQEKEKFQANIYQKSVDFLNQHIFPVDNFAELERKIGSGVKGLFLIPFCNVLECERKIKEKISAYSIRCLTSSNDSNLVLSCLFCQIPTKFRAYFGRSY